MNESEVCYRCGKPIDKFQNGGRFVMSGYENAMSWPFFESFVLCDGCSHEAKTLVIKYLNENKKEVPKDVYKNFDI